MIERLRVCGKWYEVRYVADSPLRTELIGNVDLMKGVITTRNDVSADHITENLLHECLHALDYDQQYDLTERQVHAIAAGILGLLRDNPELARMVAGENTSNRPLPEPIVNDTHSASNGKEGSMAAKKTASHPGFKAVAEI